MAITQAHLLRHHRTLVDTQACVCGQRLQRGKHVYMESGVLAGRFCDTVCLVRADRAKWRGCTIIDEYGQDYSEEKYLRVMEVSSYG